MNEHLNCMWLKIVTDRTLYSRLSSKCQRCKMKYNIKSIIAKEIQNDAKHFTCILSFNPTNDFKNKVLLLIPFYS